MTNVFKKHVKVGDRVQVITGKQKGLIGNIEAINIKKSTVIIDSLVPRIKYTKNPQGGEAKKIEIKIAIHISNVMLWDKQANKGSKIGYKLIDGLKKRYFKKSGNLV
jgi:large subunit ribosomal protein L24